MTRALLRSLEEAVNVSLAGREQLVTRARLGVYFKLETLRRAKVVPDTIREYLRLCGVVVLPRDPAVDIIRAYLALVRLNTFVGDLPMFVRPQRGADQEWDYDGRWAVHWVHSIAYRYGWSRAEILDLPVDEAAAYLQELAIEHQFEAEWQHRLSPNAWSYDKTTNTNRFEPLTRPRWMQKAQPEPVQGQGKVPIEAMPMGPVITAKELMSRLSH